MNPSSKAPVSVIIPTFNEEKHIADCLKSVLWANEIIVIDGGSADKTVEVARQYTPNVLVTENSPAETQRLKALAHAKEPWFFLLDADERITEDLRCQIETTVGSSSARSAYYVLRLNLYKNKPVHLHHPDYQLRLFKRGQIRALPDKIHRIPQIDGETGFLNAPMNHYFFTTVENYLNKLNRYTLIEASYWQSDPKKISGTKLFYFLTIKPFGKFFQYYVLKKGFMDGFFGLFYSISSAYYEWAVASRFLLEKL